MTHTPETRTKTNGTQPSRVLVMWIPEDSVGRCLGKHTQTGAPESARHCRSSGSRLWCIFHHMWLMSVGGGFWSQLDPCSGCAAGYSVSVLWNEQSVTSQQLSQPCRSLGFGLCTFCRVTAPLGNSGNAGLSSATSQPLIHLTSSPALQGIVGRSLPLSPGLNRWTLRRCGGSG